MSGFRKSGIFPLNPGAVDDRQLAPSKARGIKSPDSHPDSQLSDTQPYPQPPSGTQPYPQPPSGTQPYPQPPSGAQPYPQPPSGTQPYSQPPSDSRPYSQPILVFTSEQEALYAKRFQEGYDVDTDPSYSVWLRVNHPEHMKMSGTPSSQQSLEDMVSVSQISVPCSDISGSTNAESHLSESSMHISVAVQASAASNTCTASLLDTGKPSYAMVTSGKQCVLPASQSAASSTSNSGSEVLKELLVLPTIVPKEKKRKPAINSKTVCITDDCVLQQLKDEKAEKEAKELEKENKRLEREAKKKEASEMKEMKQREREKLKKEWEQKKLEKEQLKKQRQQQKIEKDQQREQQKMEKERIKKEKEQQRMDKEHLKQQVKKDQQREQKIAKERLEKEKHKQNPCKKHPPLLKEMVTTQSSPEESIVVCPICGLTYGEDSSLWICCDECNLWYDLHCSTVPDAKSIPETYLCQVCDK